MTTSSLLVGIFVLGAMALNTEAITIQPSMPQDLLEGEQAIVTCTLPPTVGGQFITMYFNNGSGKVEIDPKKSKPDTSITYGNRSATFVISRFSEQLAGVYSCFQHHFIGFQRSALVQLSLAVAPTVAMVNSNDTIYINVTRPWGVTCRATGRPLPNLEILRGNRVIESRFSSDSVHYRKATGDRSDVGLYSCRARNKAGQSSAQFSVILQSRPEIVEAKGNDRSRNLELGAQLSLLCSAMAQPQPTVQWLHNGDLISTGADTERVQSVERVDTNSRVTGTLNIGSITGKDSGVYTCRASNAFGRQTVDYTVHVQEPPHAPDPVLVTEIKQHSAVASWSAPRSDGNSPIQYYSVGLTQVSPPPADATNAFQVFKVIMDGSSQLVHTLTNLRPNTDYSITVLGANRVGLGTPSIVNFTSLPIVPPAPTNVAAVSSAEGTSAIVSWQVPDPASWEHQQGSVVSFSLSVSGRSISDIDPSLRSYEVTDLKKGTSYVIAVSIHNRAGKSPAGEGTTVTMVTRSTAPSSPVWVDALGSSTTTAVLYWAVPLDIGGSPITHYVLTRSPDGISPDTTIEVQAVGSENTQYTVDGLQPTTTYTFALTAVNSVGSGPSNSIEATTMSSNSDTLPVPGLVQVVFRSNSSLQLDLPVSSMKATADRWLLEYRKQTEVDWKRVPLIGRSNMACVPGLSADTQYYVRVAQSTETDRSLFSTAVVTTTLASGLLPAVNVLDIFSKSISLRRLRCGVADLQRVRVQYRAASSGGVWRQLNNSKGTDISNDVILFDALAEETYSLRHVLLGDGRRVLASSAIRNVTTAGALAQTQSSNKGVVVAAVLATLAVIAIVGIVALIIVRQRRETSNIVHDIPKRQNSFMERQPSNASNVVPQSAPLQEHECLGSRSSSRSHASDDSYCSPAVSTLTKSPMRSKKHMSPMMMNPSYDRENSNYAQLDLQKPVSYKLQPHSQGQSTTYAAIDLMATKRVSEIKVDRVTSSFPDSCARELEHSTV